MSTFCTVINCMDGRAQLPVIRYLKDRFGADYVDVVSEPGPNRVLAEGSDAGTIESIVERVKISVDQHGSVGIAVVGHHECAGNPAARSEQAQHTKAAVHYVRSRFDGVPVIGLWVDEGWKVSETVNEGAR